MAWTDAARAAAARTRRQSAPVSSGIKLLKQSTFRFLMHTRYGTGPLPMSSRASIAQKLKGDRAKKAKVNSLKSQKVPTTKVRIKLKVK